MSAFDHELRHNTAGTALSFDGVLIRQNTRAQPPLMEDPRTSAGDHTADLITRSSPFGRVLRGLAFVAALAASMVGTAPAFAQTAAANCNSTDAGFTPNGITGGCLGVTSGPANTQELAVGGAATVTGPGGTALGQGASSDTASTAVGNGANAAGTGNIAIGSMASTFGANSGSVAIGQGAVATSTAPLPPGTPFANATAVGDQAAATAQGAQAFGQGAFASGTFGTAVGQFAGAAGTGSFAGGASARATATGSIAIGGSNAFNPNGGQASATAPGAIAIGGTNGSNAGGAIANAAGAVALGQFSTASGTNALASGFGATASGDSSVAQGNGAQATTTNATALGTGARAAFAGSTAVGVGAVTSAPNQMMFGTSANTYVTPGITSAASLATQSGPVSFVTSDAAGHLATTNLNVSSILNLAGNVASLNATVAGLQNQINNNLTEERRGIAAAVAMANPPMPSLPGKTTWQMRTGFFEGEAGVGFAMAHRLNTSFPMAFMAGYGNGGGVEHTGYVGLMGEF